VQAFVSHSSTRADAAYAAVAGAKAELRKAAEIRLPPPLVTAATEGGCLKFSKKMLTPFARFC
jgi:uncharacterized protein YdeI (YjbR/CyaY-like superfamily)